MNIEFFPAGPGVLVEEEQRILFLADIHMGIEHELQKYGFHIRSRGQNELPGYVILSQRPGLIS